MAATVAAPDLAVVGAGVSGLAIAHHLAGPGLTALVVDRAGIAAGASGVPPVGCASSGRSASTACSRGTRSLPTVTLATTSGRTCGRASAGGDAFVAVSAGRPAARRSALAGAAGVSLAAGFSGHGFKIALAIGRPLAEAFVRGEPAGLPPGRRPGRSDGLAVAPETQIV